MKDVQLGLKENWQQFTILVIINAFVGGMVGMERSILPRIAEAEFHIAARTAIFSFIIVFGIAKALTNYFTGALANKVGRKNLLVIGWLFGIPVPFMLMYAEEWNTIVAANILLGINQGLTWSSTVVMKIDLVGERNRGLAMGLNEFAGYLAVAIVSFATGWIASEYGLKPYPFYIGVILCIAGLLASWLFVKDTRYHSTKEGQGNKVAKLKNIFWNTTWSDKNLGSITQAGLVNNLNDGMVWGLFPLLFSSKKFGLADIGVITAVYPAVWGISQLFTGKMSDIFSKKKLLFLGMLLQGISIMFLIWASSYFHFIVLSSILGFGTALVYPTFLSGIAEYTHPSDRAKSIGTFRLWRDLGYSIGALITGVTADLLGIDSSIATIGIITIFSAIIVVVRMR